MPKHRPAPLRLREIVFPKIAVQALVPEGDRDGLPRMLDLESAEIGFQYQVEQEGHRVPVGMRLRTLPLADGVPNTDRFYDVDVEVFAVFEMVGAEHRDEVVEYLRKVSAASALLGAIREQVAMTTARGPWGVLTIPLVGMDAIVGHPPARPKGVETVSTTPVASADAAKRIRKKKDSA